MLRRAADRKSIYLGKTTVSGSTELFHRVRPLYDAYADCIDEERYEEWPSFFEDQCFYQITTREARLKSLPIGIIQCNSKGMLIDRINSMKRANIFEPQRYRHLLGALHVEPAQNGTIRARMGFCIVRNLESGDSMLFLSGIWHDEIVETPDGLRFREKIAVLDSSRVDTLIVIPV
jgi:3-phenylpropionate/cinnamic acid dioxygenase small subunit